MARGASFEPTEAQKLTVKLHSMAGTPQEVIAQFIINPHSNKPITSKTLRKMFRQELSVGMYEIKAKAIGVIARRLQDNDLGAACFVLKTQAGWSEKVMHVGGQDGDNPIKFERIERVIIDPANPDSTGLPAAPKTEPV